MAAWDVQYASESRPSLQVFGDREKAERLAKKNDRFNEGYVITEAPKPDRTLEKELAYAEAIKYGCSTQGMDL